MTTHDAPPTTLRLDAAGVADANSVHTPGSLLLEVRGDDLLEGGAVHASIRVLAAGSPRKVDRHPAAAGARRRDFGASLLCPGLVNAHAHLDLTHIGPQPYDRTAGFASFVDLVRSRRHVDPLAIAESVKEGVRLSLAAGVVAVGDIAGAARGRPTIAAADALCSSPMRGVSYLEFFAIGKSEQAALGIVERLARDSVSRPGMARLGLSPHATYSVSPNAYRVALSLATELDLPIATHIAETPDEHEFIARGTGPQRKLLEAVGAWEDSLLGEFGQGRTPIEHFAQAVGGRLPGGAVVALAHVHDLGPDAAALAALGASVVYCPRAGEYFGAAAHFGPHRYREMRTLGLNVALGTDSIINLPTAALSVWDEMRFLRRRDGVDPDLLLRMATTHGARALGIDPTGFAFTPGATLAGLVRVSAPEGHRDVLRNALDGVGEPELLFLGK